LVLYKPYKPAIHFPQFPLNSHENETKIKDGGFLNHLQNSYGKQEKEKQRQRTRIAMIARVKMTPARNASTKATEGWDTDGRLRLATDWYLL
jgi:hypothetical protein